MLRRAFHLTLAVSIGFVAANTAIVGQDKVERRDQKGSKSVVVQGKILEEKTDGIKMKVGGKDEIIPSTQILRIYYEDTPALAKNNAARLFNLEETEKDLSKVLKDAQDASDKSKGAPAPIRRYHEFKVAMLQSMMADTEAQKDAAIKALQSFVSAHWASWEFPFAARALARLQISKSDYDSASKTLESVTKSDLIPADIKAEANFMLIDTLFQQTGKADEVKTRIAAAMSAPNVTEAQKSRYGVYLIGLETQAQRRTRRSTMPSRNSTTSSRSRRPTTP
jgi:hypothetical protein